MFCYNSWFDVVIMCVDVDEQLICWNLVCCFVLYFVMYLYQDLFEFYCNLIGGMVMCFVVCWYEENKDKMM